MSRVLVVTVGTSLFTSASWRPGGFFADLQGYRIWCKEEYLKSPLKRVRHPDTQGLDAEIRARLKESPNDGLEPFATEDLPTTGAHSRYCAELTTLLKMGSAADEAVNSEAADTPIATLTERYAELHLALPTDPGNPSAIAGRYLALQFGKLGLPVNEQVDEQWLLNGRSAGELTRSLLGYLGGYSGDHALDLVVSGGYKSYTVAAGSFLPAHPSWRVCYLPEEEIAAANLFWHYHEQSASASTPSTVTEGNGPRVSLIPDRAG